MPKISKTPPNVTRLDVLKDGTWQDTCGIEGNASEDEALARLIPHPEKNALVKESIHYLVCSDLKAPDLEWIQNEISAGRPCTVRMRIDTSAVSPKEELVIQIVLNVREVYKCMPVTRSATGLRWMITGLPTTLKSDE